MESSEEETHKDSLENINKEIDAMPISERDALKGILQMMQDKKTRDLFIRMITVSKLEQVRPINYKKSSVLPYYKKKYADWIKLSVDKVIETKQDAVLLYDDYPECSKTTLQSRAFQAFDFLYMNMDTPDLKYSEAKKNIQIQKNPRGLILHYVTDVGLTRVAKPIEFGGDRFIKLKDAVYKFMQEEPEGTKFERKDLQLSEEEQEYFQTLVADIPSLRLKIDVQSLVLFKLTPSQIELLKGTA